MDTDSTTITPDRQDLAAGPFSVSLKFNNTSAMLYRNRYLPRNGEQPGLSAQEFLCSFSIHKTEIPAHFQSQLMLATNGQPHRYELLMQRIQTRVLEPARRRQQERRSIEQLNQMRDWVTFAQQQINQAADCAYRDSHLADPKVQHGVRQLLQKAQCLLIQPQAAAPAQDHSADPEERLQQLLENINNDLAQVQAIMPTAGQQFERGYKFADYTVRQVQQLWFNTADAIAVLNQRQQFKRPNHWSEMRQKVMHSASQKATEVLASAPEQEPPGDEISLGGITGEE